MLSAVAVLGFSAVGHAETALAYQCSIATNRETGGWITAEYAFAQDKGAATAFDGLIKREFGKPISVTVKDDTEKRLTMLWEVPLYNGSGQATIMRFRAVVFKQNDKVTIQARPAGYKNMFEGRGVCKKVAL